MSLVDRISSSLDEAHSRPGPIPKMGRLLEALSEDEREALENLIMSPSYSATDIHSILQEESKELTEKARNETEESTKTNMLELAELHRISAFTIGRFRRQVRAGSLDVY